MKAFCSGGQLLRRGYAEQMLFSEINAADTQTATAAPSLTPTPASVGFPRDQAQEMFPPEPSWRDPAMPVQLSHCPRWQDPRVTSSTPLAS